MHTDRDPAARIVVLAESLGPERPPASTTKTVATGMGGEQTLPMWLMPHQRASHQSITSEIVQDLGEPPVAL